MVLILYLQQLPQQVAEAEVHHQAAWVLLEAQVAEQVGTMVAQRTAVLGQKTKVMVVVHKIQMLMKAVLVVVARAQLV
jgi:hypothetical protein